MSRSSQRKLLVVAVALLLIGCAAPPPEDEIFPYAHQIDDLPNGLRLVTVTTGYPNIVALYTTTACLAVMSISL